MTQAPYDPSAAPAAPQPALPTSPVLPASPALPIGAGEAMLRGLRGRCPRCGEASLFRRWLKPHDQCPHCAVDLTPQRADDFPAYISMLLTGHIIAPIIIALVLDWDLGPAALTAIILPLTVALMLGLLQPAKGGVIAVQWWHGLHGFTRERRDAPSA